MTKKKKLWILSAVRCGTVVRPQTNTIQENFPLTLFTFFFSVVSFSSSQPNQLTLSLSVIFLCFFSHSNQIVERWLRWKTKKLFIFSQQNLFVRNAEFVQRMKWKRKIKWIKFLCMSCVCVFFLFALSVCIRRESTTMKREWKMIYAKNKNFKIHEITLHNKWYQSTKKIFVNSMCTLGVCYKANCMYCYFCLIHATECWIFSFHSKTYKNTQYIYFFFIIFLLLLLLLLLLLCPLAASSSSSLFLTNTHTLIHSHKRWTKRNERTNENYDIRNVVHSKFVMKMKEKKLVARTMRTSRDSSQLNSSATVNQIFN